MLPRCVVNSTKIIAISVQTELQYCSLNCIINGKAAEFIVDCRRVVHYVTVVRAHRYIRPAAAATFITVTWGGAKCSAAVLTIGVFTDKKNSPDMSHTKKHYPPFVFTYIFSRLPYFRMCPE
jgi:hypothetical protein